MKALDVLRTLLWAWRSRNEPPFCPEVFDVASEPQISPEAMRLAHRNPVSPREAEILVVTYGVAAAEHRLLRAAELHVDPFGATAGE